MYLSSFSQSFEIFRSLGHSFTEKSDDNSSSLLTPDLYVKEHLK